MTRTRCVFSFIFTATIVSQISPLFAGDAVPVLLWGDSANTNSESSAVNPFLKTPREDFYELLNNILKAQPPVLVLQKDNLCVEDITHSKEQLEQATSGSSYRFIPAVVQPLSALQDLPLYNQTDDTDVDSISDGQLVIKSIASLDNILGSYDAIKNSSPNLVVVLTGKSCSYRRSERVKREDPMPDNTTTILVKTDRVLFYSSQPLLFKNSQDAEFIKLAQPTTVSDSANTPKEVTLRIVFPGTEVKIAVEFNFVETSPGYFTLVSAKTEEIPLQSTVSPVTTTLMTDTEIVFPVNFSYHCSQKTVFQNHTSGIYLNVTNIQVQIKPDKFGDVHTFADAYDCVGFTSIPIWTGIFVTAILALIMIWALSMIIDIRTMDRFDDPKGKTITISAQE